MIPLLAQLNSIIAPEGADFICKRDGLVNRECCALCDCPTVNRIIAEPRCRRCGSKGTLDSGRPCHCMYATEQTYAEWCAENVPPADEAEERAECERIKAAQLERWGF